MICEQCGANVPKTKRVYIESAEIMVCPNCMKHCSGVAKDKSDSASPSVLQERLEKRVRRQSEKDVLDTLDVLDPEYGSMIKKARMQEGTSIDDLAKELGVKRNSLAKIEASDMRPEENLIKKLEKRLNITLKIKQDISVPAYTGRKTKEVITLEDIVTLKVKKKK